MNSNTPKVEFALGSEVSLNHFKSNFARSFVTNCRESKSLDYELPNNTTEEDDTQTNGNNNNFLSLVNFGSDITTVVDNNAFKKGSPNLWKTNEVNILFFFFIFIKPLINQIVCIMYFRHK